MRRTVFLSRPLAMTRLRLLMILLVLYGLVVMAFERLTT